MISRLLGAGLCAFVIVEGTARAHPPEKLTLQSALELAEKQNLDLVAARARHAVAAAGVEIARQRPNPSVNFNALRDEPHEGFWFTQPFELGESAGTALPWRTKKAN